jgi:nitrate reductase alpha subunit
MNGTCRFAYAVLPYASGFESVDVSLHRVQGYLHPDSPAVVYYSDSVMSMNLMKYSASYSDSP